MKKELPWFRLYTKTVDDEKLKLLAFEDRWHFVALLCLKGQGLLDKGDAPAMMMRKAAVKMGLDVRSLEEVARRLEEVELIDADTLQPINWAGLQMRSDTDPTAKDRKARFLQRQRLKAESAAKGIPIISDDPDAGQSDPAQGGASAATQPENAKGTDVERVPGTKGTRTERDIEGEGSSKPTHVAKDQDSGQGFAQPAPKAAEPMRVKAANGKEYEIPAELRYPGATAKTHKAWIAYAIAYEQRYKSWPVWNATVAGQMAQFIARAGAELAPRVAVHYVRRVEDAFVVKQMHPVKLLLQEAEKWVTQTRTGMTTPVPAPAAGQHKHAGASKAIYDGIDL